MIYLSKDNSYDILAARGMMHSKEDDVYNFLNDQDYRVRTLAAQTIQTHFPTKKSFNIAKNMVLSNDPIKQELGAYILGQLGTPKMPFWKESLSLLLKLLRSNNTEVVAATLHALGHLCSLKKCKLKDSSMQEIVNLTKHKSKDIVIAALMALASQDFSTQAKNTIKKFLETDDEEVKSWANVAYEIIENI